MSKRGRRRSRRRIVKRNGFSNKRIRNQGAKQFMKGVGSLANSYISKGLAVKDMGIGLLKMSSPRTYRRYKFLKKIDRI